METQAYMIGAAVVIISAILIYFIAAVTMREKTYDEILAEQRKRREVLFPSSSASDKSKAKKKSKKKARPEHTELTDGGTSSDQEQPQKMVELELEPEIIDNVSKPPKEVRSSKGKKKPILINKQEKVEIQENVTTQETIHYRPPPKDSLALKQERERKLSEPQVDAQVEKVVTASSPDHPEKSKKRERKEKKEVTENGPEIIPETAPVVQMARRPKKVKEVTPPSPDPVKTDGDHVMGIVQAAHLNNTDILTLVDILLSKQTGTNQASDKWRTKSQKGDPVAVLEKQLTEKNQALKEEQEQAQATTQRLKEVQQELTREHQQYALLEKESKDKLAAQLQDIQALQLRMQQTHEQHRNEVAQLKMKVDQRQGQIHDGQTVMLQRLKDENIQLQEKASNTQKQLKIVQDELNKQIQERTSFDGGRKLLESQLLQMEDKIHKLESAKRDMESMWSNKYKELTDHFQREQAKASALARDLDKVKNEKHLCDKELASFHGRFKDLENVKNQREQELNQLRAQLQVLHEENTRLATELKAYEERTSGEGQETPTKPQGAPIVEEPKKEENALQQQSEYDHKLKLKDEEISQLKSTLDARLADCSHLEQEVETQKNKNNALEEEKSKASASMKAAANDAAMSQEQLEQLKSRLHTKGAELEKICTILESTKKDNETLKAQVHDLESTAQSAAVYAEQLEKMQQELELLRTNVHQQNEQQNSDQENTEKLQVLITEQKDVLLQRQVEIKSLTEQLREREEQLKCFSQRQDDGHSLEARSDELVQKESALKQLQQQLDEKTSRLEKEKEELQQQISELSNREASVETRCSDIGNREATFEELSAKLKERETALREQEQLVNDKREQLEKQLEQTQQQAALAQQSNEEKLATLQSELDRLQRENDKFVAQKNAQDSSDVLKDDLRSKENQIESLTSELQNIQLDSEELKGRLHEKTEAVEKLREQLHASEMLQEELRARSSRIQVVEEELTALKAEKVQAEKKFRDELERLESELREEAGQLKPEAVVNIKHEVEELKRSDGDVWQGAEKLNRLRLTLQSVLGDIRLRNEVSHLSNSLQHSMDENSKLREEMNLKSLELESLQKQMAELQASSDRGVCEADVAPNKDEILGNVAKLEADLESRDSYIMKLQQKLDETITENETLMAAEDPENKMAVIDSLMSDKRDLKQEVDRLAKGALELEKLKQDVDIKNRRVQDLERQLDGVKVIQEELERHRVSSAENGNQVVILTKELTLLREDLKRKDELEAALSEQTKAMASLKESVEHYKQECHDLRSWLPAPNLSGGDNQMAYIQEKLADKDELKQKYTKAMDSLSKVENTAEIGSSAAEELAGIKETLQKIFPDLQITRSTSYTWITNLEQHINKIQIINKQVASSSSEASNLSEELSQMTNANSHLEGQVLHYKAVLADTEQILNKLQNSVESEEQKWMYKLHKSDEELEKARKEYSRLLEEMKRLKTCSEGASPEDNSSAV